MQTPHTLSEKAIEEFRTIYQEEFGERLSDDEVRLVALRLLRCFGILNYPPSGDTGAFDAGKTVR